jgi:sugar lactone lactonase YvrE
MLTRAQKLEKIWETDTVFNIPESVLYDAGKKQLYVSNIDGASNAKDGVGSISKMKPDGKIIKPDWVTGLHAPKGMALYKKVLYVADVDAVVGFDAGSGKRVTKIAIEGAKFLNDLTVDPNGNLYVSDSETGLIHQISNGKPTVYIEKRTRPNGVRWYNDRLYFADAGAFLSRNPDGTITEIAKDLERSTDGIEPLGNNNFLVSSWIGTVYYVKNDGTVKELLNTKEQKMNSADIGYNAKDKVVYVPTFAGNRVVAYKLEEE